MTSTSALLAVRLGTCTLAPGGSTHAQINIEAYWYKKEILNKQKKAFGVVLCSFWRHGWNWELVRSPEPALVEETEEWSRVRSERSARISSKLMDIVWASGRDGRL